MRFVRAAKRTFRDIGLARISKDDLRKGHGTGRQEKDIRRMSSESGGEIIDLFIEDDTPASRFSRKEREKYARIVELLRRGERDRLIVWRLDRLLRIPRMLEDLIDLCEERPFLVLSLHGSIDLRTAEGVKYARDRVSDAAYESDLKSERLKRAFDEAAEMGLPHGVRAFGYACNGLRECEGEKCCHDRPCEHRPRHKRCCRIPGCPHDKVTIIEPEAEAYRWGKDAALAGEACEAIARAWNAQGFLTPNDYRPWDATSVKCTLTNPTHAGFRVHRGDYRIWECPEEHDEGKHTRECKVVGKRRGVWDPVITPAEHEALVRRLCKPGRRPPSRRTAFTGLYTTVEGLRLVRNVDRGRAIYMWQNRPGRDGGTAVSIDAGHLEAFTLELLFQEAESGRLAERVAERRRRAAVAQPAGENPEDIKLELAQLAEDKADPEIGLTREEWLAQRAVLLRRLEVAEAAQARVTDTRPLEGVDVDLRAKWALPESEGGFSVDRKRAILGSVFERIVIHPANRKGKGLDSSRVEPVWRA